jgi:hypothetical protein
LVDDPSGTTISTHALTRPADPGEAHDFERLAVALRAASGLAVVVQGDLSNVADDRAAVIAHASDLAWLLGAADGADLAARTVVVDAPRPSILPMLELRGVAGVVEAHQYFQWKAQEPADAAIFAGADDLARMGVAGDLSPLANPAFGRLRIDGGDLPGLIALLLVTRRPAGGAGAPTPQ